MRCPMCQSKLQESNFKKNYQTLVEHVSEPNEKPIAKTFFICRNDTECELQYFEGNDVFWDHVGDIYLGKIFKKHFNIRDYEIPNKSRIIWLNNLFNKLHLSYNIRNFIAKYRCFSLKKGTSALDSMSREIDEERRQPICRWILRLNGYKI